MTVPPIDAWACATCGASVPQEIEPNGQIIPASRYWHGDRLDVYCSVECSIRGHEYKVGGTD